MVVKVAAPGRSFAGVAAYCLHDTREPGEPQPETSKRVEWDRHPEPADRPSGPGGRDDGGGRPGERARELAAASVSANTRRAFGTGSPAGRSMTPPSPNTWPPGSSQSSGASRLPR